MIAAGNLDAIQGMHPALRSRIRGYGYEVYMSESMEDTPENRQKFIRFIAQEVKNDGKIPHFDQSAMDEIIREAQRQVEPERPPDPQTAGHGRPHPGCRGPCPPGRRRDNDTPPMSSRQRRQPGPSRTRSRTNTSGGAGNTR